MLNGDTASFLKAVVNVECWTSSKRHNSDAKRVTDSMSKRLALACCKLYISDSRNPRALESIERAARRHPKAPLLHIFKDEHYNRVGYTLAGECKHRASSSSAQLPIHNAVVEMIKAALESIDLREQSGSHPRLGVVDHVCFHPLGSEATMAEAAALARDCAATVGHRLRVPTFLYGAASDQGQALDEIRRALGYFKPTTSSGLWQGVSASEARLPLSPHFGPVQVSLKSGVVTVGACPWVANYNIPILSSDLAAARRIARKVAARGGGLPEVQAMALLHGDNCIEIACNLLNAVTTSPDMVQRHVEMLAREEGVKTKPGYLTGLREEDLYERALRTLKV